MSPTAADLPARAAATLTTLRSEVAPEAPNRLESATTTSDPFLTAIKPTGASPTRTIAASARPGSVRRAVAEKHSRSSLARAVTQTSRPSADVITRTGLHPAATVATTDAAGSVSARAKLITVSVPTLPFGLSAITSLVAYSQRPSGETAMPT